MINRCEIAESRSEVQPFVLWRCFVCRGLTRTAATVDHKRSRRSEQISRNRFWNSSGRVRVSRSGTSDQIGSKCPSKIRTECGQSLLPMPKAAFLAGVKSPRNGLSSALFGHGNQRALASGVGAEERLGSPRSRGRSATSRAWNRDLRCNRLFFGVGSFVAASRGPLMRWIIHDRGGVSKSERIVRAMNRKECSG